MRLPEDLLVSLENVEGFDRKSFEEIHEGETQVTSVRMNVNRITSVVKRTVISGTGETMNTNEPPVSGLNFDISRLPIHEQIPWTNSGYYLSQRPSFTFDPLFHAGCYYVQEASSMFLEQPFRQLTDLSQPMKVLDLCGAPGG